MVLPVAALPLLGGYLLVLCTVPWWASWLYGGLLGARVDRARQDPERPSPYTEIWNARRSAASVGVTSRRELAHLPPALEALVVDAQRIRLSLLPIAPLREDSMRTLWDWLATLRRLERWDRESIARAELCHARVAGGLRDAWGIPRNRTIVYRGVSMPEWLAQLHIIDEALWSFIRAARVPPTRAYR